jgi:hypothetical protein
LAADALAPTAEGGKMNNGERIRRMDNETLAYMIAAMLQDTYRKVAKSLSDSGVDVTLIELDIDKQAAIHQEWLDQEAEEEA